MRPPYFTSFHNIQYKNHIPIYKKNTFVYNINKKWWFCILVVYYMQEVICEITVVLKAVYSYMVLRSGKSGMYGQGILLSNCRIRN